MDTLSRYQGWASRVTTAFFHLLFLVTPFAFTWVNEELFEFNKIILVYAFAVVIGCGWACQMIFSRKVLFRRTPFDWLIGAFLLSQVISTIFSLDPHTSLFGYYTRFHGGLLSTFAYILLYYAFVSTMTRQKVYKILVTTFIAATGVALYAIPEHFGHSPSCFLINNGQSMDVSCWIQDVRSRVFGTFGQPNWLAAYAVTLIPLGIAGAVAFIKQATQKRLIAGILAAAASLLLTLALIYTQSRSGMLGLSISMSFFVLSVAALILLSSSPQRKKVLTFLPLKWVLGILITMSLMVVLTSNIISQTLTRTLGLSSSQDAVVEITDAKAPVVNRLDIGGTESGEIRKIVWSGALDVFRRYPLFGSGVETFAYSYYQDRPVEHNLVSEWDFLYNKAHNEYLNFLATTGIVGVITYTLLTFGVILWCYKKFWQLLRSDKDNQQQFETAFFCLAIATGLLALTISNFFGFSTVMVAVLYFLLPAMAVVITNSGHQVKKTLSLTEKNSTNTKPILNTPAYVAVGAVAAVTLIGLFSVWTMWQADYAYAQGKQAINSQLLAEGVELLQRAVELSPNEPVFYDQLASTFAEISVGLAQNDQATASAQFAETALLDSDKALGLNSHHLNFYKSRARMFIVLSQLDDAYLAEASKTLRQSIELAPTDAKLEYNLALVELSSGNKEAAKAAFERTLELKPNYEAARVEYGKFLEESNELNAAAEQYQYVLSNLSPANTIVQERLASVSASLSAQPNKL
ncbi:MAG: O-antigen ligase family protein [bacterium]|nr:O-antigen ligase family protein [bacterium]